MKRGNRDVRTPVMLQNVNWNQNQLLFLHPSMAFKMWMRLWIYEKPTNHTSHTNHTNDSNHNYNYIKNLMKITSLKNWHRIWAKRYVFLPFFVPLHDSQSTTNSYKKLCTQQGKRHRERERETIPMWKYCKWSIAIVESWDMFEQICATVDWCFWNTTSIKYDATLVYDSWPAPINFESHSKLKINYTKRR